MEKFHLISFLSFFYLFISEKSSNFALVIELERHIEILLLHNDCVIVPDLGGFMAHHIDARYDEEEHTFLPPLRTLGFNPQLTMNDSLLAQSYVEAYDMSYPEALRRIEEEVSELKQHLETEGRYELNDIGVLELNEDGKYIFSPCEAGILTPQLYGLSSFEMAPLDAQQQKQQQPQQLLPQEEKPAEATDEPVAENEEITEEEEENGDGAIIIKMSWLRNAVAVAAAVLAFFLMTTPVTNSENSHQSMSNLNNSILTGMLPKDSNMEKIDVSKIETKAVAVQKDTVQTVQADTTAVKQVTKTTAPVYRIVLASYITKKNANAFVEQLHKKGYSDAEVFIRNNVTRVVCGSFKTANEAYNKLNVIQKDKGLEEAWVLKVKEES